MRRLWRHYRHGEWFHRHFVIVHVAGLVFGVQLAIASLMAILHHGERGFRDDRDA